jgi:hypothetical protein
MEAPPVLSRGCRRYDEFFLLPALVSRPRDLSLPLAAAGTLWCRWIASLPSRECGVSPIRPAPTGTFLCHTRKLRASQGSSRPAFLPAYRRPALFSRHHGSISHGPIVCRQTDPGKFLRQLPGKLLWMYRSYLSQCRRYDESCPEVPLVSGPWSLALPPPALFVQSGSLVGMSSPHFEGHSEI